MQKIDLRFDTLKRSIKKRNTVNYFNQLIANFEGIFVNKESGSEKLILDFLNETLTNLILQVKAKKYVIMLINQVDREEFTCEKILKKLKQTINMKIMLLEHIGTLVNKFLRVKLSSN